MQKDSKNNEMVRIYWPDYTITKGKSPTSVLLKIGKKQWKLKTDVSKIKDMLAERVLNWSGVKIDPKLPNKEFLDQLGKSGMVFVWYGESDPFLGITETKK